MNFFERVPAADFPDKILSKQERNLTDPPVPFSEKRGAPAKRFTESRAAFKENISVSWKGHRHCSDAGCGDRNFRRFRLVVDSFSDRELEIKRFARCTRDYLRRWAEGTAGG